MREREAEEEAEEERVEEDRVGGVEWVSSAQEVLLAERVVEEEGTETIQGPSTLE